SSLGFYPVAPASNQYVIGSPQFEKVTLHLENGKKMIITAKNQGKDKVYVDDLKMNGKKYHHNYLTVEDIKKGGKLDFTMSTEPNKSRGTDDKDAPYSFSRELKGEYSAK